MMHFSGLAPMLRANSIQETIHFYSEVLGFLVDGRFPEECPTWCCLKFGDVRLMFFTEEAEGSSAPCMTGVLYIYVDDVVSLHRTTHRRRADLPRVASAAAKSQQFGLDLEPRYKV